VENKRVLDIGPAELVGTVHREKLDRWIYGKIAEVAAHLVGLEKNTEQVRFLAGMGYDIREGDAEQFDLGEQFDVVVAGELIEHLSNPGRFLDCAGEHVVEGGKLLLTTPNRYGILSLYSVIRSGNVPTYHKPIAKHVVYFDSDALSSLLERYGFAHIQIDYCKWVGAPSTSRRRRWLVEFVSRYRPVLLPVLLAIAHKH
jgi:SAM-dependent methyltransferase